ncbi:M20 family metallopeptidase [Neobacillus mesonae]|uniref:M20 family metallopeptidase n=1 Tax=Neobacillus mesonae TaxID=1193713 RepID=UPI00203F0017|nr:M20 family metallopeptidase [Neobacillus mesonae]MCM3571208.1 M20 family metallopeptidase [Neobacillus mesonae]
MNTKGMASQSRVNTKRMVDLLRRMININTVNPPGDELGLAELIAEAVSSYGLECQFHQIDKNRSNIVITLKGRDPTRKKLYFNGHLDTVPIGEQPWTMDPFGAEIKDGRMYGRGTTDMKGGVAALLETMIILKENQFPLEQDVVFVGTVGEEVDCLGAQEAVKRGIIENPGAILIAEPSCLDLYIAHKGALWLEMRTYGKTAHGSMPKEGINAIDSMMCILNEFQKLKFDEIDELLGMMTKSINTIHGGVATNVVPDYCSVKLDFRTITASQNSKILNEINTIIKRLSDKKVGFQADYAVLQNLEPLKNKNESAFIKGLQLMNQEMYQKDIQKQSANYYTDGSIFRKHFDGPIFIYGAGDTTLAHQPDESILISDLEKSVEFYLRVVETYQNFN